MKPVALALPALLVAVGALAHSGASGIVKERMDQMGMIAKAMKTIGPMIKGAVAYDAAIVAEQGGVIAAHGGKTLTDLFPEGSIKGPSEALPAIWEDWEKFEALADDLSFWGGALAGAAENPRGEAAGFGAISDERPDAAALAAMSPDEAFMRLARTCGGCHEDFRLKKE